MHGTLQVCGVNPHQPDEWQLVLTTSDPTELDRQAANRYRAEYGAVKVHLDVAFARGEKARLTRSVLARDQRRCRKCGNTVDARVVSLHYKEYHNPDKLVTLCRICRHARKIILDDPYDETATHDWLNNGCTGSEELVDAFCREYSNAYAEISRRAGVEGAAGVMPEKILLIYFGNLPTGGHWSPLLLAAFQEHRERDPIPDVFRETNENSE